MPLLPRSLLSKPPKPRTYNSAEAARLIGISRRTLERMHETGKLPRPKLSIPVVMQPRYTLADIEAAKRARGTP